MNDNPPAFPCFSLESGQKIIPQHFHGMTLRDFFAATININDLQSINEADSQKEILGEIYDPNWPIKRQIEFNMKMEAYLRYKYADAMIEARA